MQDMIINMDSTTHGFIILDYNGIISKCLIRKGSDPYIKSSFKANMASFYNLELNSFDFYPKSVFQAPFTDDYINLSMIKNDDIAKNQSLISLNILNKRRFNPSNCDTNNSLNSNFYLKEYDDVFPDVA